MRRVVVMAAMGTLMACDAQGTTLKAVEASACLVEDETLSVAFKNPAKARAWLQGLSERLKSDEDAVRDAAVEDAAMLTSKLLECVPG